MQQYELSKEVGISSNRGVKFLSNSPSSFSSAKEYFAYCQPNFINSILKLLFIFYNIHYLQCLFSKNNIQIFTSNSAASSLCELDMVKLAVITQFWLGKKTCRMNEYLDLHLQLINPSRFSACLLFFPLLVAPTGFLKGLNLFSLR